MSYTFGQASSTADRPNGIACVKSSGRTALRYHLLVESDDAGDDVTGSALSENGA